MAGAFISVTVNAPQLIETLNKLLGKLAHTEPALRSMGEYLQRSHAARFKQGIDPQGNPWQELSRKYLKRKPKNKDKILVLDGHLRNLIYQVENGAIYLGSDRKYAAIHQFGGQINHLAQSRLTAFRVDMETGRSRFAKRTNANFEQWATIGARTTTMPKREFLGVSKEDEKELIDILSHFLTQTP